MMLGINSVGMGSTLGGKCDDRDSTAIVTRFKQNNKYYHNIAHNVTESQ